MVVDDCDHASAQKTEIHFENRTQRPVIMRDNPTDVYAKLKFRQR